MSLKKSLNLNAPNNKCQNNSTAAKNKSHKNEPPKTLKRTTTRLPELLTSQTKQKNQEDA